MHSSDPSKLVRMPLSQDQKNQVKAIIGREGESLELTIEELEQRITPRLSSNHNETLLTGR